MYRIGSFFITVGLIFGPVVSPASAATLPYAAQVGTGETSIPAGESRQITLKFKNVGSQTWIGGSTKTAVYLYGNSSIFGHPSWPKDDLGVPIAQSKVVPGGMASAVFWVKAPKTPGTYTERFLLSYGTNAWVKGSTVTVKFNVTSASVAAPAAMTPPADAVMADAVNGWGALLVDKGGIEWQMDPGGHTIVTLGFKNTGSKTWVREGTSHVSLYTGKGDRQSVFKDSSWLNNLKTTSLVEAQVKPNEIGHFKLQLRAPVTPGTYQESFQLAAEDTSWIPGGVVTLPIRVLVSNEQISQGILPSGQSTTGSYKTMLLLKSAQALTLLGNGRQALTFGFKNTGTANWGTLALQLAEVVPALEGKLSSVRDETWLTSVEPVRATRATAPGEIGFLGFTIKAPTKKGSYIAKFKLVADNNAVQDGFVEIPITVTADGYIEPTPAPSPTPSTPNTPISSGIALNPQPLNGDESSLPNEPIIRVGLFATTDNQMILRGVGGGFKITANGSEVCRLNSGESATISYDRSAGVYRANGPRCTSQSSTHYVALQDDGISPLELTDFSRPVSWLPGANDNKFRGKLELRFTPKTDKVWIINELPIEAYLYGIAETSNSSPQEYQRALLTGSRTYAMYHIERGTKHANEFYIVDATYDQVYRGYGAEIRNSNVIAAINATRGQIVTYNGKLAITPYYSRSDGRTRDWTEVWGGGPYPWLVSVPVPWDNGKTLWGHGVGLSATGALGMAADGKTYDQILKHFYTGIELRKAYK